MTNHFKNQSLPNGWEESQFKDIAAYIQRGKSPKYAVHSNFPVINQKCIRWHGIDLEFLKYLDPNESHKWSQERYLQPGDILWNSTGTGTIGRASIYKGSIENAVADSHVTIIRVFKNQILPEFVFYFIMSPYVQKNIENMQSGSTNQVELGRAEIEATKIPLPPFNEQKRIVAKIEELFSELDQGLENIQKALGTIKSCHLLNKVHALRQSILKKAFSGELVPQDPIDEPASTLLDHIKAVRGTQSLRKTKSKKLQEVAI
jgi:type I restriction enzyme S subunit